MERWTWRRIALIAGAGVLAGAIAFGSWQAIVALNAWNDIERVEFDTNEARERLPVVSPVNDVTPPTGVNWDALYDGVLVIGSDEKPKRFQEGVFADAVIVYLAPANGADPVLVSFPRDLLIRDPCTGEEAKLDRLLTECGQGITGPEHVALAIEDFTGIGVDHFALLGFEGFVQVVDTVGGIELCVPNSVRETPDRVLPAGCSTADGETALWYVRSRRLQEQVDGEWRFVEGVSDIDRAERQQQFLFSVLGRVREMRSPTTLNSVARELDELIVLSDSLHIPEAVGMAWHLRGTPADRIHQVIVPTEDFVSEDGEYVRRATTEFAELLEDL